MEMSSQMHKTRRPGLYWLWHVLSYAIGVGCLYWVFHNVRPSELLKSVATLNWWWVPLAAVLDLLVYVCAAWEWQLLLRPTATLSFGQTLQAVFAGRFANDVLPVHAGYVLRVYLASRWSRTSITDIIPSLLVERLLDGWWLALGIGILILFYPLPGSLARTGEILGGIILLGIIVVAWVIVGKTTTTAAQNRGLLAHSRVVHKLASVVARLKCGVRVISRSRLLPAALGLSIAKLLLQAMAFLSLLWAYAFGFPLRVQLAIFFITLVGISVPSTPASMGVFQITCSFGLRFFGVPKPVASSFALLAYVVLTAPLALAGFVAVTQAGLTLRQVRNALSQGTVHKPAQKKRFP